MIYEQFLNEKLSKYLRNKNRIGLTDEEKDNPFNYIYKRLQAHNAGREVSKKMSSLSEPERDYIRKHYKPSDEIGTHFFVGKLGKLSAQSYLKKPENAINSIVNNNGVVPTLSHYVRQKVAHRPGGKQDKLADLYSFSKSA